MDGENRESELEEIIERYANDVLRYAYLQLRDRELARDASQQVFLKAYGQLHKLRSRDAVRPWLMRVTVTVCANMRKSKAYRESLKIPADYKEAWEVAEPDQFVERLEGETALGRYLDGLPAKYRTVLYLRYYRDYTTEEIARILHVPHPTVRTRLRRGHQRVRKLLEEERSGQDGLDRISRQPGNPG